MTVEAKKTLDFNKIHQKQFEREPTIWEREEKRKKELQNMKAMGNMNSNDGKKERIPTPIPPVKKTKSRTEPLDPAPVKSKPLVGGIAAKKGIKTTQPVPPAQKGKLPYKPYTGPVPPYTGYSLFSPKLPPKVAAPVVPKEKKSDTPLIDKTNLCVTPVAKPPEGRVPIKSATSEKKAHDERRNNYLSSAKKKAQERRQAARNIEY